MSKKNSFFEEDDADQETPTAVKTNKETSYTSAVGEYYGKNVLYKYKDGTTCRVVYNPKDINFITRETK